MGLVQFPATTRHPHANFLLFYSGLWFKRNGIHQDRYGNENGGEGGKGAVITFASTHRKIRERTGSGGKP